MYICTCVYIYIYTARYPWRRLEQCYLNCINIILEAKVILLSKLYDEIVIEV